MSRGSIYCIALLLLAGIAHADDAKDAAAGEAKLVDGMSIVGNDEAPKSLAIVPWKASRVGASLDFSSTLGDGVDPLDKEVFMRELDYYQIRVGAD